MDHTLSRRGRIGGDGLTLSYTEWACADLKSHDPPIVLLHGLTSRSEHWDAVAGLLGERRRVIALDARGHGESDWASDEAYAPDAHFADLVTALDGLGVERCVLVGYSMGGSVAILTAGALPERVDRLVVVDSYPAPEMTPGSRRIAEWIARSYHPSVDGSFGSGSKIREGDTTLTRSMRTQRAEGMPSLLTGEGKGEGETLQSQVASPFQRPGPRRFDPVIARKMAEELEKGDPRRTDLWPLWDAICCPVLLVRGELSNVLPPHLATEMIARQPNATMTTISGVAHPIPYARPAELASLIERFISAPQPDLP